MSKKSQITFFIVLGVVIILIAGVFLSLNNADNVVIEENIDDRGSIEVKNYVTSCLEDTLLDASYLLAYKGGTTNTPTSDANPYGIRLSLDGRDDTSISLEKVSKEVSKYVKENIFLCVDFEPFTVQGYEVDVDPPFVESTISNTNIIVHMQMPVEIKKDGMINSIERFSASVEIPLGKAVTLSKFISEDHLNDYDGMLHVDEINLILNTDQIQYEIIPLEDGSFVLEMVFKENRGTENFIFNTRLNP